LPGLSGLDGFLRRHPVIEAVHVVPLATVLTIGMKALASFSEARMGHSAGHRTRIVPTAGVARTTIAARASASHPAASWT
jgi:hypothetical protein